MRNASFNQITDKMPFLKMYSKIPGNHQEYMYIFQFIPKANVNHKQITLD